MYTASAQSCQQTRGRFAFVSVVWVFRLVLAFLAGFRGLRFLGFWGFADKFGADMSS